MNPFDHLRILGIPVLIGKGNSLFNGRRYIRAGDRHRDPRAYADLVRFLISGSIRHGAEMFHRGGFDCYFSAGRNDRSLIDQGIRFERRHVYRDRASYSDIAGRISGFCLQHRSCFRRCVSGTGRNSHILSGCNIPTDNPGFIPAVHDAHRYGRACTDGSFIRVILAQLKGCLHFDAGIIAHIVRQFDAVSTIFIFLSDCVTDVGTVRNNRFNRIFLCPVSGRRSQRNNQGLSLIGLRRINSQRPVFRLRRFHAYGLLFDDRSEIQHLELKGRSCRHVYLSVPQPCQFLLINVFHCILSEQLYAFQLISLFHQFIGKRIRKGVAPVRIFL